MNIKISLKDKLLVIVLAGLSACMIVTGIFFIVQRGDPIALALGLLSFLTLGAAVYEGIKENSGTNE